VGTCMVLYNSGKLLDTLSWADTFDLGLVTSATRYVFTVPASADTPCAFFVAGYPENTIFKTGVQLNP
jgi:hypothetical protein